MKPTIETGAMTLVLLVKNFKSQMIALLLKNGVTVPRGYSDQQIAMLMANLLKVSKSFFDDLNAFIQNPKVIKILSEGIIENAQYLRASGFVGKKEIDAQYFKSTGDDQPTDEQPTKQGFWAGINFGNLFSQTLGAFGQFNTNQSNVAIAKAHAQSQQAGAEFQNQFVEETREKKDGKKDETMGTTTIVILSLVGVAILGTIIYFVARPKQ